MSNPTKSSHGDCERCGTKDVALLHTTFKKGDGMQWLCPICSHISHVIRKHGEAISPERYEYAYRDTLGHMCKCCFITRFDALPSKSLGPFPDFDERGKFRGIICRRCKWTIIMSGNSRRRLESVAEYVTALTTMRKEVEAAFRKEFGESVSYREVLDREG